MNRNMNRNKTNKRSKMKKMMLMAILVFSQFAFSAAEITRLSREQAQSRVEGSQVYKQMEKAIAEGKSLTADPVLAGRIQQVLDLTLKNVVTVNNSKIMNLLNVDAKMTMSEIARLASIAKDKNSNAQEVAAAKKAIELIVLAGNNIDTIVKNSTEAKVQKDHLTLAIEMADKVAHFNYNSAAKDFQKAFESALESGKSVKEAIKIAGKDKITEEDLRKCDI